MQSCKMDKIFIFAIFLFCAVGVLVTEKTNFVQFLRSRCHLKALYIFLLGLILFCYNQLFERKSTINFPDFSIFRFFTSHFHSFIKYRKILRFSIFFKIISCYSLRFHFKLWISNYYF